MILLDTFFFILGLIFGSFLSALSYRIPKRISIARGRSFCPNCRHQIAWFDNIPLFSYLMLGGKCRNCKKRISVRYPAIELATALGFLFIYSSLGSNIFQLLYYLIIFCLLVLIFVIDLEHQIIPDSLVFLGILISVLYFLLAPSAHSLFPSLFAGFFAATLLMLIHLATRGRGMGLGDIKFAVLGGMITGLNLALVWLFASFLTGGLTGIILILGKKAGLKDKIAFGPFLVIGLVITVIFGKELLRYLGLE